eukprot:GHVU01233717.1.p1 GENE.GHVU01233717.1~~GHVU01233717.1.p1  ORF type:complete len:175 (+),score=7.30 GHVU01233717.1:56-580(+)
MGCGRECNSLARINGRLRNTLGEEWVISARTHTMTTTAGCLHTYRHIHNTAASSLKSSRLCVSVGNPAIFTQPPTVLKTVTILLRTYYSRTFYAHSEEPIRTTHAPTFGICETRVQNRIQEDMVTREWPQSGRRFNIMRACWNQRVTSQNTLGSCGSRDRTVCGEPAEPLLLSV